MKHGIQCPHRESPTASSAGPRTAENGFCTAGSLGHRARRHRLACHTRVGRP